jgi:cobalt-zinc-cadmium efflux system membrane fusion protein
LEKEPENGSTLTLARDVQLRILGLVALGLGLLLCLPMLWRLIIPPSQGELPRLTPGSFHPEPGQLSEMGITRAGLRDFQGLVSADGAVAANDDTTTPVFSPFSGRVERILVRAGSRVKKGDPLMVVAATEGMQAQSDLIATANAARAAEATLRNATEAEARQHALYTDGSLALKDWHQSQLDLATVEAGLRTANAAMIAASGKLQILGFTPAQAAALEKGHDSAGLSADAAVVAPVTGIVLQRSVGPGQFLQAGNASQVFSIGDPSTLWLVGNVREDDASAMWVGAPVDVTVMAVPGRTFHGRLNWVAPAIDATTHRLAVRAEIANSDGILKPDMFASMVIHIGGDRHSPAVPERAVIRDGSAAHLWVVSGDGDLSERDIHVGRIQDGYVEVLDGLAAGERYASTGGLFLDSASQDN